MHRLQDIIINKWHDEHVNQHGCNLQGLANLAWSMAHLDFKHEGMLDAIVTLIVEDLEDANARDVAELISALAILNHPPASKHMDALAQHMVVLLSDSGECHFGSGLGYYVNAVQSWSLYQL